MGFLRPNEVSVCNIQQIQYRTNDPCLVIQNRVTPRLIRIHLQYRISYRRIPSQGGLMKPLLISKVMRIPRSLMRGVFIVPIMICLIAWPCWAQEGRATPSKTTFINVSPLYYLASGAYAGLAVRPTWYAMIEKASGGKSTYSTLYVTPKAGYRWFPRDSFGYHWLPMTSAGYRWFPRDSLSV